MPLIKQNYLSPIEFRFVIERLPHVTFFTQNVDLPGITGNPVRVASPFNATFHSGDELDFSQLTVQFKVDEYMKNYREIFGWMMGLNFPEKFEQFSSLKAGKGLYSDASIVIMTNQRNPNLKYTFKNIFPVSLSNIAMDTTQETIDNVDATVTFQIDSFSIEAIT